MKKSTPIGEPELLAYLRDIATHPARHQALSIARQIPSDTHHQSGIDALQHVALVRTAKTELEAERHLNKATAHWKDFMFWDDAIKTVKASSDALAASKFPRPSRRDPLREKIISLMSKERDPGRGLKEILKDWEGHQIGGLQLTYEQEKSVYFVDDENETKGLRKFTLRQLRTIFAESS